MIFYVVGGRGLLELQPWLSRTREESELDRRLGRSYMLFVCLLSTAEINVVTESGVERKGAFQLTVYQGKSRQRLKAGSWRQELMQKPWRSAAYWLASRGFLSWLSDTVQGHLPRGWHHPQWTVPSHIDQKPRKCPMGWPRSQSDGGIVSTEGTFSR